MGTRWGWAERKRSRFGGDFALVPMYMPRVAAFAAMRREMESGRWALCSIAAQTGLAWLMATLVFQIGHALGLG